MAFVRSSPALVAHFFVCSVHLMVPLPAHEAFGPIHADGPVPGRQPRSARTRALRRVIRSAAAMTAAFSA
jgi:hypothetical protein